MKRSRRINNAMPMDVAQGAMEHMFMRGLRKGVTIGRIQMFVVILVLEALLIGGALYMGVTVSR